MYKVIQPSCGLIAGLLSSLFSYGQDSSQNMRFEVEAGSYLSTSASNPFWLRSNQYGEVPLESQGITVRLQAKKEYKTFVQGKKGKDKFSYGYGARAVFNAGTHNQLLLSELYGKVRYGAFEFYAGRRKEAIGLFDSTLSAGSYSWSGNALPMPKIQISLPNFTPILKNGLIAVKGNYAHGWFGSADSIENYFLHQKSLYIRIGKPSWRFKFIGGFNHQVQWGGTLRYVRYDTGVKKTRYGSDLESYWYVITTKSLYPQGENPQVLQVPIVDGTATAEGGNRVGNHLGTLDIGLEYEDDKNQWLFYRQSIYEDGSLFYLVNISDGLTGVSVRTKNVTSGVLRVVLEYLQTSNQGGSISNSRTSNVYLGGYEDYFNNGRYIDGWTYRGQTIGTPFIMPLRYTTNLTQNLANNPNSIVNNRVNAVSLGVMSRIKRVDLTTRLSVSHNMGNYSVPLNVNQVSVQQQITFPVKNYTLTTIVAYDNAGVLRQNLGLSALVKRTF